MPPDGFIIQLHHFLSGIIALAGGLLGLYRFGIKPRLDAAEQKAVDTATYRTEVNNKLERLEEKFNSHKDGENGQIAALTTAFQQFMSEAREDRRGMYEAITGIKTETSAINAELKGLEGQMKGYFQREQTRPSA